MRSTCPPKGKWLNTLKADRKVKGLNEAISDNADGKETPEQTILIT
jgi:hypothetical protein